MSPPPEVAAAYEALPGEVRAVLLRLRALVLCVAEETGAGPVTEALRWGQPSYLAPKGATLRLGQSKSGAPAVFVTCTTTLIEGFRPIAPRGVRCEGRRAVVIDDPARFDPAGLAPLIGQALNYHTARQRR